LITCRVSKISFSGHLRLSVDDPREAYREFRAQSQTHVIQIQCHFQKVESFSFDPVYLRVRSHTDCKVQSISSSAVSNNIARILESNYYL